MLNNLYSKEYFIKRREAEPKDYFMTLQFIELLNPKNVFDFGTGTGKTIHCFIYFGTDAYGYEPVEDARRMPFGMSNRRIFGTIPNKTYELVTCLDVLEHIDEKSLEHILEKIIKLSSKYILFSICDLEHWHLYKDETHVNCKSREWWEFIFKKFGLEKVEVPANWIFRSQLYLYKKADIDGKEML